MEKEIAKKFKEVNDHFVEKFGNGDFDVLHQSNTSSKVECDGEVFWLWHSYGIDGLISNLDNPIHLNMPADIRKKVYEKLMGRTERESLQTEINVMQNRLEGLKRKLKEISK